MREEEPSLRKYIKEESTRKTFAKVFDRSTIEAVHKLATKGYFDLLEFIISTGKEAHVFRAVDRSGNFYAVKIYKTSTSNFKHMGRYIDGDFRFRGVKKNKRDIVMAWTQKEFKNLAIMRRAGVRVPTPMAFLGNVMVMEFIGVEGKASPPVKESPVERVEEMYDSMADFMARMVVKGEIVHADLSEFNILNKNGEIVVIDVGQAVLTSHPEAKEFFERDVANMARYFRKMGLEKSDEQFYSDIKARKASLK